MSFLDFPGEVRNRIYSHLLPKRLTWHKHNHTLKSPFPTAMLRANKQIYQELLGLMQDLPGYELVLSNNRWLVFRGIKYSTLSLLWASFSQLNFIHTLGIRVAEPGWHNFTAQRMLLLEFFGRLEPGHWLQRITFRINDSRLFDDELYTRVLIWKYCSTIDEVEAILPRERFGAVRFELFGVNPSRAKGARRIRRAKRSVVKDQEVL